MQNSIGDFRAKTGGDLSNDSVQDSMNSTSVYSGFYNGPPSQVKRGLDLFCTPLESIVLNRRMSTIIKGTQSGDTAAASNSTSPSGSSMTHAVSGIHGFVEQLTIPQANAFMTVFLFLLVAIGAIMVGILLSKISFQIWAMHNSFPKKLAGFRKRFLGLLMRSVVNLILTMYGVWTLLFIFESTNGDSWGAKAFACVSWTAFTAVLVFFTLKIRIFARRQRKLKQGVSALFEDQETWRRYSLFYDNYKRGNISLHPEQHLEIKIPLHKVSLSRIL